MYWVAFDITLCYRALYALKNEILQSILQILDFRFFTVTFPVFLLSEGGGTLCNAQSNKSEVKDWGSSNDILLFRSIFFIV